MSIIKYINSLKSGYSFLASSVLKRPVMHGLPPAIGIELTNLCNLHCPECPSGNGSMRREKGFMDLDLFRKIAVEIKPYVLNMNLYFQGEPMLHPHFFLFLGEARGLHTTVSTNGHFLDAENCEALAISGLKKIIVSLDGFDEKSYSAYRLNGDFNKVTGGIRNLAGTIKRNHSPLKLVIQVLVNRYNEHQLPDIKEFAKDKGAALSLKSMQVYSNPGYWMPSSERFRRYETNDGIYGIKSKLPETCARLWINPVITWDGKVLPCCFDKDAEHVMGDINYESFRNIWYGDKYTRFRNMLLNGNEKARICTNCTSGLREVRT